MSMQPVNKEQVAQSVSAVVALLSHESISVPAPMLEAVMSGKQILQGILGGNLVICQEVPDAPEDKPAVEADDEASGD